MTQTPQPIPVPSHSPESPGGYQVTAKERLSDPWQILEFPDRDEAEEFAARACWLLPDEHGREVVPVG